MATLVIPTEAPAVPGPPQGQWHYADWEDLPDDGNRYEIIDGVVYMTTPPSSFHQWITGRLWRYVAIPAEDQELGYAFSALIGVIMPGCDPVQPDFVVVLREHAAIVHDKRIWGVPELIIEILSPHNAAYDREVKLAAYARAGLPGYAIVDPGARALTHSGSRNRGVTRRRVSTRRRASASLACPRSTSRSVRSLPARPIRPSDNEQNPTGHDWWHV